MLSAYINTQSKRDEQEDNEMQKKSYSRWSRKFIGIFMALTLTAALVACGKNDAPGEDPSGGNEQSEEEESKEPEADRHHVEITIKDYGTISVELYREVAPITVDNFLKLAGDGFYDGLTFHRIIDGFMMQGGDPEGTGYGGSDETITGEFEANGHINNLSHTRGAISMARSQELDSASSQFFIVHEDSTYLDGWYACFGYVTEGMDVVDAICQSVPVSDDGEFVAKENQPVIESIKVVD